jgi:hypothetical protein
LTPFQPRPSHSCANPLDDRLPFYLCDCSDYDDHRSTKWATGVNVFPQADKLDSEVIQFVENLQEMTHIPRDPIESRDEDNIESMPPGIHEKLV